jgi:hypothetical protein
LRIVTNENINNNNTNLPTETNNQYRKQASEVEPKNGKAKSSQDIANALQTQGGINIFNRNNIDYDNLSIVLENGSGDGIWPPYAVRQALTHTLAKFYVKPSQVEGIGNGLFANEKIAPGQVLGVYGGCFRDTITDYTLELDYNHYDKRGHRKLLDIWVHE